MDSHLPHDVQLQYMRPGQLEAALRQFPVVYVPFGLIEWRGADPLSASKAVYETAAV